MKLHFKLDFIPLRLKFITLFLILITVPFLISGTITYKKYSSNVEHDAREYTYQIISQLSVNIDRYVKDIGRVTVAPLYDDAVMTILKKHGGFDTDNSYVNTEEILKINMLLASIASDRPEIRSILLFTNDGNLFSNSETSVRNNWNKEGNSWMDKVVNEDGVLTVIPPHQAPYYMDNTGKVLSIARVIREPYSHKHIGFIKVDLEQAGFEKVLSMEELSETGRFYIFDREDNLIYPVTEQSTVMPDGENVEIGGRFHLSSTLKSEYTDIRITGLIPVEELRKDAIELTRFTLIISLASLVFAYIFALFFSDRLVKPISHLQGKMKQVEKGFFDVRANVTTHDEIGRLSNGFNKMVGEIDRLLREVYEVKLREREAELIALQSQINPHFLYNTLETINMKALEKKDLDLSSIATSLGKLLRYTVDKQEKPVYLKDEILFVECYLQIQAFRLGDLLSAKIHVDPSFERCLVPKLILQPFVENVIEHALNNTPVTVRLKASIQWDDLILIIQDNGSGMSVERKQEIEEHIYSNRNDVIENHGFGKAGKGYALRNVHQRIRLLFGEPYGVYIDRKTEGGTTFILRLPFRWEDQNA